MTTTPNHDAQSIANDAKHVLSAARADVADKRFAKYVDKHELDVFAANIAALESGEGARSVSLHAQVAAGGHPAQARGPIRHIVPHRRPGPKGALPHHP